VETEVETGGALSEADVARERELPIFSVVRYTSVLDCVGDGERLGQWEFCLSKHRLFPRFNIQLYGE
jgi:hypothetical protein